MELGLFAMPSHPPERSLYDGQQWDLQMLRWADELGYIEAWIGEHHVAVWEPPAWAGRLSLAVPPSS
jgi:alkanesulfonate monooxygenase SsuD/methylene tetrahydromethanopterin reductase-like flavin-dependent oxidoreductase (luciferase family)